MSDFLDKVKNGGVIPVGVDDGFDETKIVLPDGYSIRVPSLARAGSSDVISVDEGESKVFVYKTKNGSFTTGAILDHDSTAFDGYPMSAMNRVIVSHALRVAGLSSQHKVHIGTGLPLKKFYRSSSVNKELIEAKQKNLLLNDVLANDSFKLPNIASHKVMAEGLAAWFDIVLTRDNDGRLIKNADAYKKRIAIIDIGGRTTDIAVISQGNLEYQRSSTIEAGMLSVKEVIKDGIYNDYDGVELTNEQMHIALSEGKVKLWGDFIDISALVSSAQEEVANRIYAESMRKLKKAADIDDVVFVGGTVCKFGALVDGWFKNQSVAQEPAFANARGMQKFVELSLLSVK